MAALRGEAEEWVAGLREPTQIDEVLIRLVVDLVRGADDPARRLAQVALVCIEAGHISFVADLLRAFLGAGS